MKLLAFGDTTEGKLGVGDTKEEDIDIPTEVPLPRTEDPVAVSCGMLHSLLVTARGDVYAWGRAKDGRLGNGDSRKSAPLFLSVPTLVAAPLSTIPVAVVAAGARHSVAVTREGDVYCWGKNNMGQLGVGDKKSRFVPTLAVEGKGITGCAAGGQHTIVFSAGGGVWSWGSNACGQFGLGAGGPSSSQSPMAAEGLGEVKVKAVAAGTSNSFFITSEGELYAAGDNALFQLGLKDSRNRSSFTHVSTLANVTGVSCMQKHTVACTADGKVYAWGAGRWQNAAASESATVPVRVSRGLADANIVSVTTGGFATIAIDDKGAAWAWDDETEPEPLAVKGRTMAAAVGNKHVALVARLAEDGESESKC